MKATVTIKNTSMRGQSIFVLSKPGDDSHFPLVEQQLPTDVAEYLKGLVDKDQQLSESDVKVEKKMRLVRDKIKKLSNSSDIGERIFGEQLKIATYDLEGNAFLEAVRVISRESGHWEFRHFFDSFMG